MKLNCFGDSITVGSLGPTPGNSYVSLLQSYLGATLNNNAVNGSCSGDQAIVAQSFIPVAGDICTIMLGVNDSQRYFTVAQQEYFRGFITEIVSKATYPNRISCQDPLMVKTGSWTNCQPKWSHGCYSVTVGSKATTYVNGKSVIIGTTFQDYQGNGVPGSADVYIDDVFVRSYSSNGIGMNTAYTSFAPAAIRIDGLTDTSHKVEVRITSGFIYLEYILGSSQPLTENVYLLTPSRTYQSGDNGTVATALGVIVNDIATKMQADGRNVYVVQINPLITSADVVSDNIHWNNSGNLKAYQAIVSLIQSLVTFSPSQIYIGNDGNYYVGEGTIKKRILTN